MRSSIEAVCRRFAQARTAAEAGMSTAEYAVGTIAACSFAALLIAIIKEGSLKETLFGVISQALSVAG